MQVEVPPEFRTLSNRVDELEKAEGQGRDNGEGRADAEAEAELFKEALRARH